MITHTGSRGTLLVAAALAFALGGPAAAAERKPNILVIMTDDVGWGDIGAYGGGALRGAPTPNIDRLAAEGVRFASYYGQASCTAGRAAFITGRIPIRTALSLVLIPGDPDGLTAETPTVAEFLRKAGYTTVQLGKWHLGDRPENFPTENGFDEMYHTVATEMMSHMDWWPTFAGLLGLEPPPHLWKDDDGKAIVFDGVDDSAYLLGKGPSQRHTFFYYTDQSFVGVRVENYKFLFTTKDTWLGTGMPLVTPAVFNLFRDPREQYDILFNGAAPTQGTFTTSPGRFAGPDHGWTLTMYMTPALYPHFAEIAKIPNKPSAIRGGPFYMIPPEHRP
jgi:arylsulfatase A-like enzyme